MFTAPDSKFDPTFESLVSLAYISKGTVRLFSDHDVDLDTLCRAVICNSFGAVLDVCAFSERSEVVAMRLAARGVKVKLEHQ